MSMLVPKNQPVDWFERMVLECTRQYPMHKVELDKNSIVVDCGSNVGGFVHSFKNKFDKFYCFEASSYNIEMMKSNLSNFKDRFEIFNFALSKESGKKIKLLKYIEENGEDTPSGNFGTIPYVNKNNDHGWKSDEYELVDSLCLEGIYEKIDSRHIDLLKVDIEGSEYDFLMDKDLSNINYITMELHNFLIDMGVMDSFLRHISITHDEVFSTGSELEHWIKLWKRK